MDSSTPGLVVKKKSQCVKLRHLCVPVAYFSSMVYGENVFFVFVISSVGAFFFFQLRENLVCVCVALSNRLVFITGESYCCCSTELKSH